MKKYFVILVVLLLAIFVSGCTDILITPEENLLEQDDDSIAPGKGRLKIYLTDAPGDYLEVNITISKIEAHIAGEDGGAEGYWVVLKEWPNGAEPTFDLIKLQDVSELLVDGFFDVGKYTQLRLFITEANIWIEIVNEESEEKIVSDSDIEKDIIVESSESYEEHSLNIPSNLQTGLKLIHPFEIVDSEETVLTIDFDAEKSIIKTGNGNYKLKPVIKVITGSTDEEDG